MDICIFHDSGIYSHRHSAQFERKSAFEWHIKPFGRMRVPGVIFASEADLARIDEAIQRFTQRKKT